MIKTLVDRAVHRILHQKNIFGNIQLSATSQSFTKSFHGEARALQAVPLVTHHISLQISPREKWSNSKKKLACHLSNEIPTKSSFRDQARLCVRNPPSSRPPHCHGRKVVMVNNIRAGQTSTNLMYHTTTSRHLLIPKQPVIGARGLRCYRLD